MTTFKEKEAESWMATLWPTRRLVRGVGLGGSLLRQGGCGGGAGLGADLGVIGALRRGAGALGGIGIAGRRMLACVEHLLHGLAHLYLLNWDAALDGQQFLLIAY